MFVAASEKRNISAAGRDLGLAPAVASARLAKLETTLQADLLHRSTRKVTLSQEGAAFLPYAREILAQEAAGRAALGLGSAVVTGTLRFTASSTFAQLYIAPLVPVFLATHPGIHLDLRFSDIPFDLIEGSYDLALRNMAPAENSLKSRKLADDQRVLCASPGYLAEKGTPRVPEDLANHQLIAFREQKARQLVGRDGTEARYDPVGAGSRLVIDDGHSQKVITLAGAGISMNSLWSVHEELAAGSLVRVLPDFDIHDQSALWLVYPKAHVLSAKVRTFIDFLLTEIGANPPWLGN
nr:LysR family transcriptional regulator [Acanthopleuribacter pedis]